MIHVNISQDTFNKIVTMTLLLFFMVMYAISFVTGKSLNLQGMLGFLLPILTHSGHLLTNFLNNKTSVQAASTNIDPTAISAIKDVVSSGAPTSSQQVVTNGVH